MSKTCKTAEQNRNLKVSADALRRYAYPHMRLCTNPSTQGEKYLLTCEAGADKSLPEILSGTSIDVLTSSGLEPDSDPACVGLRSLAAIALAISLVTYNICS